MEIIIKFNEDGGFTVKKTDGMPVFTAVGMMELAKKLLLDGGDKEISKVEEEVDTDETVQ